MRASLEREIEVCEVLIRQLNECAAIFYKEKRFGDFRVTLVDLQKCKTELRRLIAAKDAELEAERGAAEYEAHERSRIGVSARSEGKEKNCLRSSP